VEPDSNEEAKLSGMATCSGVWKAAWAAGASAATTEMAAMMESKKSDFFIVKGMWKYV